MVNVPKVHSDKLTETRFSFLLKIFICDGYIVYLSSFLIGLSNLVLYPQKNVMSLFMLLSSYFYSRSTIIHENV